MLVDDRQRNQYLFMPRIGSSTDVSVASILRSFMLGFSIAAPSATGCCGCLKRKGTWAPTGSLGNNLGMVGQAAFTVRVMLNRGLLSFARSLAHELIKPPYWFGT